MQPPTISVIVPVRNEDPDSLNKLTDLANLEGIAEVVIVNCSDQHSTTDKLKELQSKFNSLKVINSEIAGRAHQMNQGEAVASGSILWFIHADTSVPESSAESILKSISTEKPWGRFDIRFDNPSARMKLVAFAINLRSGVTWVCSGDQAIFLLRSQFHKMGGFPNIPLLEDIALTKKLRREAQAIRIRTPVTTSARRWETHGYLRTIFLMWLIRFLFWVGVSPATLARLYR
ncbi:MAG: glycosyltransferase [Gammaproteobacteria bacterium]|nr:glycosyltransferase [Gammaproteobacteria bacterium]